MKEYHILNLGAGVQSSTLFLMAANKEPMDYLDGGTLHFDYAIFADTQEEPDEDEIDKSVYKHLGWLGTQGGPLILTPTIGKLGDDLLGGENSTGQRFASIPAYTRLNDSSFVGMTRRQCTREYKADVVERCMRREILGLKPRQRVPKDVRFVQYMGFSFDEPGRAANTRNRFRAHGWSDVKFPLFEEQMTRSDCRNWLKTRVPHEVPRSACAFCPYRSNREWLEMKLHWPKTWARAVEVDEGIRIDGAMAAKGLNAKLYIHRSGRPLAEANLDARQGLLDFEMDCEGGCGL